MLRILLCGNKAECGEFGCRVLSCCSTGGGRSYYGRSASKGLAFPVGLCCTYTYIRPCVYSIPTCPKFDLHRFSERNYYLSRGLSVSLPFFAFFGTCDPVGSHLHRIICHISSLILSTTYFPVFLYSRFCFRRIKDL